MVKNSIHKWMSTEMERLSIKWKRCMPSGSGYNRIQTRLSKNVAHILNNDERGEVYRFSNRNSATKNTQRGPTWRATPASGPSLSVWDEDYPTIYYAVRVKRCDGSRGATVKKVVYDGTNSQRFI